MRSWRKDANVSDEEVWTAIRYLDPESDGGASNGVAVVITVAVAVLIACTVCALMYFRGL